MRMSNPTTLSKAVSSLCALACMAQLALSAAPSAFAAQETPGQTGNLLPEGDFETNGTGWILCGGARVVDKQAGATAQQVHGGRYGLRIGAPAENPADCANDTLGPSQVAAQDFTIPTDASDVTLSFWYQVQGDYPVGKVNIALGTQPVDILGGRHLFGVLEMNDLMPGWHLFRQNMRQADVDRLRGQTLYLQLYIQFSAPAANNWAMYFDDFRITPYTELAASAPFPVDLAGDGARPLVLLGNGSAAGKIGIYRIDTDGGNRVRIADLSTSPANPSWSPDGKLIAYENGWISPETPLPPNSQEFVALASQIHVMNADGSAPRQIFRLPGNPGRKEQPLLCLRTRTCVDEGLDALDVLVTDIDWAPDAQSILSTVCRRTRFHSNDRPTSDASCNIHRNPVPAAPTITTVINEGKLINQADGVSVNNANKLVFLAGPSLTTRVKGIWEADLSAQPPAEQQLYGWLTAYGSAVDLRSNPDTAPVWAPDGRFFVTYRKAEAAHFVPISDTVGGLRVTYHIVLNDRTDPAAARTILLADHGSLSGRATWSPDGKYILYTLYTFDGRNADIWWLNVQNGATGRVTRDGISWAADWLPTHVRQTTQIPTLTPNPALTRRFFLPVALRPGNSTPTGNFGVPVLFATQIPTPNPTPRATPVNPTAVPPRGISGRIVYKGAPVNDVNINLETCSSILNTCDIVLRARTDANGRFSFTQAGAAGLFGFRVTYRNNQTDGQNTPDARFMEIMQSPVIYDNAFGERIDAGTLEIADVPLSGPANNASVATPVTFSWTARGIAGDKYRFSFGAGGTLGTCSQSDFDTNTSFVINGLDCAFPNLQTGQAYTWRVFVQNSDGSAGVTAPRTVSFTQ